MFRIEHVSSVVLLVFEAEKIASATRSCGRVQRHGTSVIASNSRRSLCMLDEDSRVRLIYC